MSRSTTVRRTTLALAVGSVVACSGGGGGGGGGAADGAVARAGDDKALILHAMDELGESPVQTLRTVSRIPGPDGVLQLSNCTTVSWSEASDTYEETASYPDSREVAQQATGCEPDWVRQHRVHAGDGVLLTETFDDSVPGDPWPSRGWRECRSTGDLAAREAAEEGGRGDPVRDFFVDLVEKAGPVTRSSVAGLVQLTFVATEEQQRGATATVTVSLDDEDRVVAMRIEREIEGSVDSADIQVLPAVPPRRPSDAEVEEVVEVLTVEEQGRCADSSQPAGGS